ncbi:MAG: hypothetical protein LUH07_10675 [Lachnospiraceae bacterium]|nr:hypothetical protein [Lachnospiraceae bacterium]
MRKSGFSGGKRHGKRSLGMTAVLLLVICFVIFSLCTYDFSKDTGENETYDFSDATVPDDLYEWNGHYYYIFAYVCDTWNEAKAYCEALGGYLAVISSEEENAALCSYWAASGYKTAYFGYSDSEEEGSWVWVSNEDSTYTNWASGEPNSENIKEDFAEFYYGYPEGEWNDGDYNERTQGDTKVFICEWSSLETSADNTVTEGIASDGAAADDSTITDGTVTDSTDNTTAEEVIVIE